MVLYNYTRFSFFEKYISGHWKFNNADAGYIKRRIPESLELRLEVGGCLIDLFGRQFSGG